MKSLSEDIAQFIKLARPFTLVAPFIAIIFSGLSSAGWNVDMSGIYRLVLAGISAMMLNSASNALNQVYDLEIDKINQPERPLPLGKIGKNSAIVFSVILYFLSLFFAGLINMNCFVLFALGTVLTVIYSVPPFRLKRYAYLSNLDIALARGVLLFVAGWSVFGRIDVAEPWLLGLVMGFFIFGAATTKDYSDVEGDRRFNCITLPVKYGVRKSIIITAPFFVFPWLLLGIFSYMGLLSGNRILLLALSIVLTVLGINTIRLLFNKLPDNPVSPLTNGGIKGEFTNGNKHPAWKSMYLMMILFYVGVGVSYINV